MATLTILIAVIYYAFVALVCAVLVVNFVQSRDWQRDVLYLIVLLPFLLRLLRLK
jgi:hypothetical protein